MTGLNALPIRRAGFIVPMECARVSKLPDGSGWVYEIKLDGYRAVALNSNGKRILFSRRGKSFNRQYPRIVEGLRDLPENTVVDGEVVALNAAGLPDFNLLQNVSSATTYIHYFVFDLLIYKNRDLTRLSLSDRRKVMRSELKFGSPLIHIADFFEVSAADMLRAVRQQRLEGVVAKRKDSAYEPGKRSGAWSKYRVNREQELVIGGYVPGNLGLDSLIVGYYRGDYLIYVGRVRSGFVPAARHRLFKVLHLIETVECPFANLPQPHKGRWRDGLTADVMKECVWVRPALVAQIEFLDWTEGDHLRHARFVRLREDKDARRVFKEQD